MHFNAHVLFVPVLFAMSGVLAQQQTGEPTSATPAVTYPTGDAFIFCSGQDCADTCEIVGGENLDTTQGYGEYPPNDMGFQSIYWYDPESEPWVLYTSANYYSSSEPVTIGPNTCYNLYLNSVPTDYYYYWFEAA